MATDYTTLSTPVGTGDKIATDSDGTGLWQYVKVAFGADGTQTIASSANPLPVTGTVDLGATDNAVLDAIAASVAIVDNIVFGAGTEAAAQRVTIATDSTGVLSVDDNAGSLTVDNPTISVVGGGVEAAAQRVTIATDSTGVLSVDDNGGSLTIDNAQLSVLGGGTEAAALRVTIANDSTGVLSIDDNGSTVSVDDGAGSLTVDYATTGSGTAAGALRVELPTNGTGVVGLNAGTNAIGKLAANSGVDIGDVDVTTVGTITPGTAATSLGKAEDAGHADGDVGVMALSVRKNTAVATSGSDSDYQPLITDTNGRLHVIDINSAAALVVGGGTEATAQRVTIANNSTGLLPVSDGAGSLTVDYATTGSGTAAGALRVELPTNGTGVLATVGAVTAISNALPAGNNNIGDVDIVSGTLTTVSTLTGGGVAHGAGDSGNPLKTGARARTANITAESSDDRVDTLADSLGYLLTRPYSLNQNLVKGSTAQITDTTSTEVIAAQAASTRTYITGLTVTNSDATVGTLVKITDGSGGTTMWQGYAAAAGGGFAAFFPTPLRGTAATAVHAVCTTTSSETYVSATGYIAID